MATNSHSVAVARSLFASTATTLLASAAIFALIFAFVGVVFSLTGVAGADGVSAWDFATYGPKYYLMSLAAVLTAAALPMYVRQGVTRREFVLGAGWYLAGLALAAAVLMTVGYQVEGLVYDAAGWTQRLTIPHLYESPQQAHLVVLEFTLVFLAHLTSGWLVGTGFARLGGWGALTLVPALVPALAVDVVLQAGWVGQVLDNLDAPATRLPLAVAVSAVLVSGGYLIAYLAVRRMPVAAR